MLEIEFSIFPFGFCPEKESLMHAVEGNDLYPLL